MPRKLNPAERRYLWRLLPAMAVYAVTLTGSRFIFKDAPPAGATAIVAALLPALAIVAAIAAMGLYLVEETDEYLRLQHAKATLLATGVTLSAATIWGFLEDYGLVAHLPAWWAFVVFCVALGPARSIVKWRG